MSEIETKDGMNRGLWISLGVVFLALMIVFFLLSTIPGDDEADDVTPPDITDEEPSGLTPGEFPPVDPNAVPVDVISSQTVTIPGVEVGMSSEAFESLLEERFSGESQTFNVQRTPQTANGYSLVATVDDMADDSVRAQEITALFRPGTRDSFVLSEYSVRVQCRRGSGDWQTQACS